MNRTLLALAPLLALGACSSKGHFPDGFLWGTATAGFQVEAGCPTLPAEQCEDRNSDWYQWVTDPELVAEQGNYLSGDPISAAPGYWELYSEDHRRAVEGLNTNALRISLEWSRLFPDASAEGASTVEELDAFVDTETKATYRAILADMRSQGLTPLVTLNHYTLPLWIHDGKACHQDIDGCTDRGWLDKDRMLSAIALYAGWCAKTFGDQVDLWATLNEPFAVALAGYLQPGEDRTNPPGIAGLLGGHADEAIAALFNMMEAHARMYDAVHDQDAVDADGDGNPARVGLVVNLVAVAPEVRGDADDLRGAEHLDYLYNRVFLNATIQGEMDTNLDGQVDETRADMAGRMDYLGVNYYTRLKVDGLNGPIASSYPWTDFMPVSMWERYPEGLVEVLELASEYGLPTIVTETGTPEIQTDGAFFEEELRALSVAWTEGRVGEVEGFFVWTLMDNYEWNHGMQMEFGLYDVDTVSKERTLRTTGSLYASIAASGGQSLFGED